MQDLKETNTSEETETSNENVSDETEVSDENVSNETEVSDENVSNETEVSDETEVSNETKVSDEDVSDETEASDENVSDETEVSNESEASNETDNNEIEESENDLIDDDIKDEDSDKNYYISEVRLVTKIFIRMILFILCSFIYIGIYVISLNRGALEIQTKTINSFVSVIMYLCFGISFLSLIFLVLYNAVPKFKEAFLKIKYKIKMLIFNILDWVLILPLCTIAASICFCFFFTLGSVDGSSMRPNYSDGETVFISYLDHVDRSDVVVAYITIQDNVVENIPNYVSIYPEFYIKRVIGLPGDTLTWENGYLTINGNVFDESSYFDEETIQSFRNYSSYNFNGNFKYKEAGEVKTSTVIPDGYYFVMGDNRNNSRDSRMIGLIPSDNIIGVVKFRFTSSGIKGA